MFNIFNSKKKKLEEEREDYIKARKMALDYIKKMNQEHGQGINQAEYKNKLNSYQEKASVSKLR